MILWFLHVIQQWKPPITIAEVTTGHIFPQKQQRTDKNFKRKSCSITPALLLSSAEHSTQFTCLTILLIMNFITFQPRSWRLLNNLIILVLIWVDYGADFSQCFGRGGGRKMVLKRWSGTLLLPKVILGLVPRFDFTTANLLLIYTSVHGRVRCNSPRVAPSPSMLLLPSCLHFPRW